MADRLPLAALSDSELEQRLVDLGPRLYPTTPDLAAQVRQRLESEPVSTSPQRLRPAQTRLPAGTTARAGAGYGLPSPHAWGEGLGMRGVLGAGQRQERSGSSRPSS